MVIFSQEQNNACSKTHLSDTTQEQTITYSKLSAGHMVRCAIKKGEVK